MGMVDEEPRDLVPDAVGPPLLQSLQFVSLVSGLAIPGLTVRACSQRDVECMTPMTEFQTVRADGRIDLVLYEGFNGFLEIVGDGIMPIVLFYPEPLAPGQTVYATPVSVIETGVLPGLSVAAGVEQDPMLGLVVLRTLDCQAQGALGVSYDIDKSGTPWFFVDGLPSTKATETIDSGLGGFLNVATGVAVVSGQLESTGRAIVAPTSILVRAGWMTAIRFVPEAGG
jgi:hypothetical protein